MASTGPPSAAECSVPRTWSRTTGTKSTRSLSEGGDRRDSESLRQDCRDLTRLHHNTHTMTHRHTVAHLSRQLIPLPTHTTMEYRLLIPPPNITIRRRNTTAGTTATPPSRLTNTNHAASVTLPHRNKPPRWPRTMGLLSSPQEQRLVSHILKANIPFHLLYLLANSSNCTVAQRPHFLKSQLVRYLSVRRQRSIPPAL